MLADSHLTPAAVAAIRDLLEPGENLADISTWADQQREVPNTGPWHYANLPITESRYDAKFCQPKGCVVSKIEDFRRVLLDPNATRKERQQALKFLVHYLQDLHQPVHVGDNGNRGCKSPTFLLTLLIPPISLPPFLRSPCVTSIECPIGSSKIPP
jgi:hypothetical protein